MPTGADGPAARWFAAFTRRVHDALPPWARRFLPATFIGYALINGSAFLLDMAFLALISHFVALPYGVAFSLGYGLASIYAFVLNRWLNFREHGDLGRQSGKYAIVIVSNYLIWIVGFASVLQIVCLHIMIARVTTACCEGLYIYVMLRWWVFPRVRADAASRHVPSPPEPTPDSAHAA